MVEDPDPPRASRSPPDNRLRITNCLRARYAFALYARRFTPGVEQFAKRNVTQLIYGQNHAPAGTDMNM